MNVTLCSAFRNASGYIPRYFAQVGDLRAALDARGDKLLLVVGEGDSTDNTHEYLYGALVEGQYEATFLDVTHGGPEHGSIEHPQRFKQLAGVWNEILMAIQTSADIVVFCESDLVWETETLMALIDHLDDVPAVAPMVMDGERSFYDVWGFRMDGQRFTKEPPYLPRRTRPDLIQDGLIKLDSAGSVLAMRGELARRLNMPEADVVVGLCRNIYEQGGAVYVDPALKVVHP